jgi:hypothetical protein
MDTKRWRDERAGRAKTLVTDTLFFEPGPIQLQAFAVIDDLT